MNELFSYYEGELDVFISESLIIKDTLLKRIISEVSDNLIKELKQKGIEIDTTYGKQSDFIC